MFLSAGLEKQYFLCLGLTYGAACRDADDNKHDQWRHHGWRVCSGEIRSLESMSWRTTMVGGNVLKKYEGRSVFFEEIREFCSWVSLLWQNTCMSVQLIVGQFVSCIIPIRASSLVIFYVYAFVFLQILKI